MKAEIVYLFMMRLPRMVPLLMLCFTLPPAERFIRIDFPNGGELLRGGSEVGIRWHSLGVQGDLAILLFKEGDQYATIASATANDGAFQWSVPTDLPDGARYRLRICSLRDLRLNDFSDRDFAISK
ncbi:MAG: hypothetical protein JXO51_09290 [Candidatus Aminicenantes bacterium]|nr:hypothetical protein [Candidatus Aminicenantes bacterium]